MKRAKSRRVDPVNAYAALHIADQAKVDAMAAQLQKFAAAGVAAQDAVDTVRLAAALTPKSKRGGRRPNQKGRPRELVDPLSRTFTLERADHARIEALARRRGESLGKAARAIVAAGLEVLGG